MLSVLLRSGLMSNYLIVVQFQIYLEHDFLKDVFLVFLISQNYKNFFLKKNSFCSMIQEQILPHPQFL